MRRWIIAASIMCACIAPATAKKHPAANGSVPIIDEVILREHTRILSSDAFGGRKPGTPAEEKTVQYIAAQMEKAGLQPGNGDSWFQQVPLVETKVDPATAFRFIDANRYRSRQPWDQHTTLAYGTDVVVLTKHTEATAAVASSEVVFAGYGITAPEKHWDDYAGLDVRGKTVIVLVNDPDWRSPTLDGPFGGRAMSYYGRWTYKHDEAARRGAAAILIVHQTQPAAYPWSVVTSSWTGLQLDIARPDGGASRPVFEGWITAEAAQRLLLPIGGLKAAEAKAGQDGFRAVPLPWKLSAQTPVQVRRFTSRNVIGTLPGRYRPGEYVLFTAHWDHFGHCRPGEADQICHGAVDNASGVAGLLTLAKAQAQSGPAARTMVFLSITGEESGLLGSAYYAAHPIYPLKATVGGINMDGLNVIGRTSDVVVTGAGKSELEAIFARAAARQSRRVEPEPRPEDGGYFRSDHFSFAKVGVPMLDAGSGTDVRGRGMAFGQAAEADYVAHRYHQPSDRYDPNWDWSGAIEDLAIYANVGRDLANSRMWPNWLPGAEFRAARDTMRAGEPALSAPGPKEGGHAAATR